MKKILVLFSTCMSLLAIQPAAVQAWGGDCCDPNPCCDPCYNPCDTNNFYVGVLGGANLIDSNRHHTIPSLTIAGVVTPVTDFVVHSNVNTGWYVGGTIGYRFNSFINGLRGELEFTYRQNDYKSHSFTATAFPTSTFHFDGSLDRMSYMVNGIYDICIPCSAFNPYIGVGIGYDTVRERLKIRETTAGVTATVEDFHSNNKHNGFAWQVIAGLGYKWNDSFLIAVDYRFHQGTNDSKINNNSIGVAGNYYF